MDNIFCIECGFELPSTAKFCKKCGVEIEVKSPLDGLLVEFIIFSLAPYQKEVTPDRLEYFRRLKLSADQGNADAQYTFGCMYKDSGTKLRYSVSSKLFKLAADQGHAEAQYELGLMYRNGEGLTRNFSEAFRLSKLAADQGHARAPVSLGMMYEDGMGVTQSYIEARKWYTLSVNRGIHLAKLDLDRIKDK